MLHGLTWTEYLVGSSDLGFHDYRVVELLASVRVRVFMLFNVCLQICPPLHKYSLSDFLDFFLFFFFFSPSRSFSNYSEYLTFFFFLLLLVILTNASKYFYFQYSFITKIVLFLISWILIALSFLCPLFYHPIFIFLLHFLSFLISLWLFLPLILSSFSEVVLFHFPFSDSLKPEKDLFLFFSS